MLAGLDSLADRLNLLGVFEPLTRKMAIGIAVCIDAGVFMILKPGKKNRLVVATKKSLNFIKRYLIFYLPLQTDVSPQ